MSEEESKLEPKKEAKQKKGRKPAKSVCDNYSSLETTIGADNAKKVAAVLPKFMKRWNIDSAVFERNFRAFRLFRGNLEVDWLPINDVISEFSLDFPLMKSSPGKIQLPSKRVYRRGVSYE